VTVISDPSTTNEARRVLGEDIEVIEIGLDDSWIRDNGPIFVRDDDDRVAIVKFGFNAWGGKFPPFDKDANVPLVLARQLDMRHYIAPMILEGGSISVDGEGTLLTTEQCLLNSNRNPDLTMDHIERVLHDYLGVKKVIWLARGVEDDLTDGHVDGVAGFAGPHLVVAGYTEDESDPNFITLRNNIEKLESATDAKGRSLEIVKIVQARPWNVDGNPITSCYSNHYIANKGVVFPTYGIEEDKIAKETLEGIYDGREVAGVDCRYIEIGGGAVHCITQQKPVGNPLSP
jgi:agmatine deiminase